MHKATIVVLFCLFTNIGFGQNEDHIWMFGFEPFDIVNDSLLMDTTWGASNIDFNFDPPLIQYDADRLLDFNGANSSLCNSKGVLVLYSNGQSIYDGINSVVEDTINYSEHWDNWSTLRDSIVISYGMPMVQGVLTLPNPKMDSSYYIFYQQFNLDELKINKLLWSQVEYSEINETMDLVQRDQQLLSDTLVIGGLNAVRHANGRDWWILCLSVGERKVQRILFDPEGFKKYPPKALGGDFLINQAQLYFSPSGDYFATNGQRGIGENEGLVSLVSFDRCSGEMEEVFNDQIDGLALSQGISFSPNGRFLFASNVDELYQYDLNTENILDSKVLIAEWDGFEYFYESDTLQEFGFPTRFGWMALAPDGRIYISPTSGSGRLLSVINTPNNKGIESAVAQHSINLPTSFARTMPNFPNFRLGPSDGSECDSLGFDNNPIANFRYSQDVDDPLKVYFHDLSYYNPEEYLWDFGNSQTSNIMEPFITFEEKGTYEVCLSVSNENSTNQACKSLIIGTSSNTEIDPGINIEVYPNPIDEFLLVSFKNYLPLEAEIKIFNLQGQLQSSSLLKNGMDQLDLRILNSGLYILNIYDQGIPVFTGKFLKL